MRTISLATIQARNSVNQSANIIGAKLHEMFEPHIGKKIKTKQGYWTKKFEKEVLDKIVFSELINLGQFDRVVLYSSYQSLICEIKKFEPESRTYVCNTLYFGRYDDQTGILTKLYDTVEYREDYDHAELQHAIEKVALLKQQLSDAESVLKEFSR